MGSKPSFTGAVSWSFLDQIFLFFVNLIITAILARLIAPSEFGLLAMVAVFTGFLNIFKDAGINASIIHKQNISKKEIDTIFWFLIILSGIISLIIIGISPYIAKFYGKNELVNITIAMGILTFIGSFSIIPGTLIVKQLRFKQFFFRNIGNKILTGAVGIFLAYRGYGVWALILSNYVANIYLTIVNFKMVKWRPSFYFNRKLLVPHLQYGMPLLGLKIFTYFSGNIDTLLVGKRLGPEMLGYYNKAYGLMRLPVSKISGSVSRVLFPSLSKLQNNYNEIWRWYLKLIKVTAYVSFPVMGLIFLLADVIVLTLYGPNWKPSIPIIKAFSLIGAVQSLTYTGTVLQSVGKTQKVFYLNIFLKGIVIIGIAAGIYLGDINGLIIGFTITSILSFLINKYFLSKWLKQKFNEFLKALFKPVIVNIVLVFFIYFVIDSIKWTSIKVKAIIVLSIWIILYIIASEIFGLEGYKFFKSKLTSYRQRKRR